MSGCAYCHESASGYCTQYAPRLTIPTPTEPGTPQTAAGRAMLARLTYQWSSRENIDGSADILAIEAEAYDKGRAARDAVWRSRLEVAIDRLDCIVGGGEEPTGVPLGLDYGTAREWAEAITAILSDIPETP